MTQPTRRSCTLLKLIQGITFDTESVRLDGNRFVDCKFINCTLEYSGGDVAFEGTSLEGCHHHLYGYALQKARYMRHVGLMDSIPDKWIEHTGNVN